MYPVIETNYPYISSCDIAAIQHLYNDGKIGGGVREMKKSLITLGS